MNLSPARKTTAPITRVENGGVRFYDAAALRDHACQPTLERMPLMPTRLSRRHVLRGLGAAVSLPLLDAMLPRVWAAPSQFKPLAKSDSVQPRLICCYVPNGVNILDWVPKDSGSNYTLSPTLETLKDHRADFTVISGVGHPASQGGHSGAGCVGLWTPHQVEHVVGSFVGGIACRPAERRPADAPGLAGVDAHAVLGVDVAQPA